ncbi:eukaryotic translation initiation factor 2C [Auriculariales sp. MPI-PUGE-AT-0066]|nr:eukaryotic translation initiation factor 2C [Auriculariales sp. MPI-PUGE-AT-0066]
MPPRGAPAAGRGRGRGRGGPPQAMATTPQMAAVAATTSNIAIAPHVQTIAVRRPGHGTKGRLINVVTNHFEMRMSNATLHQYDAEIRSAGGKPCPARMRWQVMEKLQAQVPQMFTPRAAYDGNKILVVPRLLPFAGVAEFTVDMSEGPTDKQAKPAKVLLKKTTECNLELLHRFVNGQQSLDNDIISAITALNIIVRAGPASRYPTKGASFFTPRETRDIGNAIILVRGYFQSVRAGPGRMLLNLDISTGAMYKPGNLIDVCLDVLGLQRKDVARLYAANLNENDRDRLSKFLSGVSVVNVVDRSRPPKMLLKILKGIDSTKTFPVDKPGAPKKTISIAKYFQETYNRVLAQPKVVLADLGRNILVPLELLEIKEGQLMNIKRKVPLEKTNDVLAFATRKPQERFASIIEGLTELKFAQNRFLIDAGIGVDERETGVRARVLPPPTLKYGPGSKVATVVPRDGAWNMVDKRFVLPAQIKAWAIVVYERKQHFDERKVQDVIKGFRLSAKDAGVTGFEANPVVEWHNPQGIIADQLRGVGGKCKQVTGNLPTLIVSVLPNGATDIYYAIKHFGDIMTGVATQCLLSKKCGGAKPAYWANVLLKVNVKLGGINVIPDAPSVPFLSNPAVPALVLGADVVHPPQDSKTVPSFAALVGNVDGDVSKYIARSRAQPPRQEMIDELGEMAKEILLMYGRYRDNVEKKAGWPKRVIFYRDGVSEGQFQQVLDHEIPQLRRAFAELGIDPAPKLTVLIVGKRHHVRMRPSNPSEGDRSGNCPSGTIIDTSIVHPTDFDWYLQSHGGLLGTSRSAHYTVLLDENGFAPDAIQALSFALCHVYARSTRAVSIPAPVYYADIVCARARAHYDPSAQQQMSFSEDGSNVSSVEAQYQKNKEGFKQLHRTTALNMYFM